MVFSSHGSYIAAVSAHFMQLNYGALDKKVRQTSVELIRPAGQGLKESCVTFRLLRLKLSRMSWMGRCVMSVLVCSVMESLLPSSVGV